MKTTSRLLWAGVSLLGVVSLGFWLAGGKRPDAAGGPASPGAASPQISGTILPPPARTSPSPDVPVSKPAPAGPVSRLAAFSLWAERFASASPQDRAAQLAQGGQLAGERRAEMLRLIKSDPARALAEALPYRLRQQLPESIASQLEQPVSGRGELKVIHSTLAGQETEVPQARYQVVLNRKTYEAYTYGQRLTQPSRPGIFLHGIGLTERLENGVEKRILALSPEAGRILEPEEAAAAVAAGLAPKEAVCGVTGGSSQAQGGQVLVAFGEKLFPFCQPAHAVQFNRQLTEIYNSPHEWNAAGFTPAGFQPAGFQPAANTDTLPPPGRSATQGIKKLLYIRALFADDPVPPQDEDGAQATTRASNQYFKENSYGTLDIQTTVTPLLRLPQKRNYYGERDILFQQTQIQPDMLKVAATFGFFANDYDFVYILFNPLPEVGFFVRDGDGLLTVQPGALAHGIAHNLGLGEAYSWDPSGRFPSWPVPPFWPVLLPGDPDSVIGHGDINAANNGLVAPAPFQPYGDTYDLMGGGFGHLGALTKWQLNWLPDAVVKKTRTSTTNRIYAFDTPRISEDRFYAVRVHKDFQPNVPNPPLEREYWASYRQGFPDNPWESGGIELHWNFGGINTLLDTTPETSYAKQDAAITVGRTFSDPPAEIHFTPIAQGGGPDPWDKWIDLVVQIGPFPQNQPPVMSLEASALTVTNGATVTFTVTAQDPNGDALAYNWDFGDLSFGRNTNVMTKTFTTNGHYVVRCEVSDMKGGLVSAFVVVTVGTPATFTISGRVLDINGNPVAGARVHNSGTMQSPDTPGLADGQMFDPTVTTLGTYRYAYTDSQGYYAIGNVLPGTYTNRAFRFGYRTDPFNFSDPVSLTNGSAFDIDFVATPLPHVRVQNSADTQEDSPDPGIFTIFRDGDLSTDMRVRYFLSGSAVLGGDYLPPPGNLFTNPVTGVRTTNTVGFVTIPAGFASADVAIIPTPIINTNGFGAVDARLTLMLQTGGVRIASVATNVLTTNGAVVITNTMFVMVTNAYAIPGWEVLQVGPNNAQFWFQTDPTYVLGHAEATVRIADNDPPAVPRVAVVAIQANLTINPRTRESLLILGDSDATETRGDGAMLAFVRLGASLTSNLVVNYTLSGEASNGVDFVQLSGTATIPAGEYFVLVPVRSINDLFVEGNEELQVAVVPSAINNYSVDPQFGSATVVVVEDDLPFISIYATGSTLANNAGTATVTVSRTGTLDTDLLVNYLVTGTATSGQDYQGLPGSVTIPAGQLTADIVITPINNPTSTLPKTVTVLLSDSPAYNIYNNNSATVTLVDRARLPVVTLETVNATVSEGGGLGVFRVRRTAPLTNSLLVYFEVGGTAWEGSDYSAIGTNVLIPAGAATANININPINDTFLELGDVSGQDDVILQLRPGTNYLLGDLFGGVTSGTMLITDDDTGALPSVGFYLKESSVREDDGPPSLAILWVKCSANPATNLPITVEYRITGPASAVSNVNYIPIPGVTGILNFVHYFPPPANVEDQLNVILVTNLNDNLASGNKTFTVTLSNPARYVTNMSLVTNMGQILTNVLITPIPTNAALPVISRTHTVTIIDVGVNKVTITPATPLAYESGPQLGQFIVTRTGPTNQPLTITFVVTGTAASGNDFSALGVNNTITIPAGTNTAVLTLLPLDDPTEEVAESVIVTLLNRPGYSVGNPASASIILVSDDGTLQFTSANYHFYENAGPAIIPVLRTGDTNLAASVDFQIFDGTATNLLDFLGTNGTIFFAPGQTIQNIVIPLIDDLLVEDSETFTVALANPSGGVPLGGQNSATVFIDNDDAAFDFSTNTFYVNENALNAFITVQRRGFTNAAASVRFATADNTARAGNDYVGTNLVLNFAPGITSVVTQVRILNDTNFEGDEAVTLLLSNPSTNTTVGVASNSMPTLLIVDDECTIEFAASNFDVPEYAGSARVVVHRNGGTVHPLTVTFSTRNNTASNGVDYTAVTRLVSFRGDAQVLDTNGSGALMFQAGDRDITVLVPILDDAIGEGNETFFVRLNGLTGPGGLPAGTFFLTPNTNSTVTILDNETPGNLDYEYNASIGANDRVRGMAFQSDQKVVFGGDFTTFNGITFNRVARLQTSGLLDPSFNPGAGANDSIFAVAAQPDNRLLVGGLFTTFDGVNRIRIARLSSDGNIDLSFNPGTGPNNTVRAIAVQADGKILIAGEFATVNGTNRSFLARLNSTGSLDLSFNANVNNPVYSVVAQADGKILAGGAFTAAGGTNRNHLARLNSDGSADISFDPGAGFNGNVNSIARQADGRILVGGLFTSFGAINRNYLARLNADASLDAPFNLASGPNAAVQTVAVQPNGKIFIGGDFTLFNGADRLYFTRLRSDGMLDSTFNVGSGANGPVRTALIQGNSAIVIGGDFTTVQGIVRGHIARIHGDEKSNITGVEFASAVFQVIENQGPALINVIRTGNTNTAFTVQVRATAGTATSGVDFTGVTNALAFAPGQTVSSFSIPIVNDTLFELDESVFLRLTNASSPAIDMSGQTNATLLIVDDEKGVQFATNNFFVIEEATNAVITVVRSGTLNGPVTVEFRATTGTATSGVDFIGVTNSLSFASGETTKTILIPILDDNAAEADETVLLSLVNPTGATTNAPFQSTLTIVNTDTAFGTFTFNSTNRILILDGAPALPYPSTITIAGLTGLISRVAVTLVGLTHTFPGDIDMLLVGPGGQTVVVMSDAGGTFDLSGITLRFEDGAPFFLPDNAQIVPGTYKPTDYAPAETFYTNAPPYGHSFAGYAGTGPNGDWSLYVMDDRGTDVGEVLNGWRLEITTVNPSTVTDLGIELTDSPDPIMAGNTLTYSMTVTNAGPLPATAVVVTDVLPPSVSYVSATSSQGSCTNQSGTVSCALGGLAVGGSGQITLRVTPLTAGRLTNTASIVATQPDVTPLNSSATTVTDVTAAPVADLNIGISDAPDPLFAGSNITYTINLTNTGPLTASAVVFTDNLPPSLGFVAVNTSLGSCNVTGNSVSCNLGDMASGVRAFITVIARSLASGSLTNTVSAVSGTPDLTPAVASAITTALNAADLLVYQLESADPAPIGNPLTYSIVVTNLGVSAAHAVNVIDTLPPGASFLSVFPSQGSCANIGTVLICDLGTISNGAAAIISVDVQPLALQPLINVATANSIDFDPNPTNNTSTEITATISLGNGIIITPTTNAQALATAVTAGGATGIRVTGVELQAHQTEVATSSGLFIIGSPPFTYNLTRPGIVLSTGNVKEYETGPNTQTGRTTSYGVAAIAAQEALLDPITGVGGNDFDHFDVTRLDLLFDMLPGFDHIEFKVVFGSEEWPEYVNSPFIDGFGIYLNGSNIAFTAAQPININHPNMIGLAGTELDGVLAPGGNAVLTFSANVPANSLSNLLTFIVADTSDSVLDTTVYVSSLQGGVGPNADVAVLMSATPEPVTIGSNLTYSITVQNRGPNAAPNVIVTDVLPPGVNFLGAVPTQGSCLLSNATVLCALGTINNSATAGITLTLQPLGSGRITNVVTVRSDLADFRSTNDLVSVASTVVDPGAFLNAEAIILADAAPSLPNPSVINVSGLAGVVSKVTASLVELSHTYPADLDVLLVGPRGQKVLLMSDAGAGNAVNGITLRFDDSAATTLPQIGQLFSGSFRPTDYEPGDVLFPPAPAGPYASALSAFDNTNPNGDWSLYVTDDHGVDSGVIAGGWRLNLQTVPGAQTPTLTILRAGASLVFSWPDSFGNNYILETTAALGAGAVWTAVGGMVVQGGGFYTVTVPLGAGNGFYRLRAP